MVGENLFGTTVSYVDEKWPQETITLINLSNPLNVCFNIARKTTVVSPAYNTINKNMA